jgi:hypothetical protein
MSLNQRATAEFSTLCTPSAPHSRDLYIQTFRRSGLLLDWRQHTGSRENWKNSPQFSAKSAFALKSQMRLNSHLPVTLD